MRPRRGFDYVLLKIRRVCRRQSYPYLLALIELAAVQAAGIRPAVVVALAALAVAAGTRQSFGLVRLCLYSPRSRGRLFLVACFPLSL